MKSAKFLKGWRMHGRYGIVTTFLCIPVLPATPAVGWKAPPGMLQCLSSTVQLLPGISHPSVDTEVCSGACPGICAHEVRRQKYLPHLGCVDDASVDFLTRFSFKCGDICRLESTLCFLVHSFVSSRAVAVWL